MALRPDASSGDEAPGTDVGRPRAAEELEDVLPEAGLAHQAGVVEGRIDEVDDDGVRVSVRAALLHQLPHRKHLQQLAGKVARAHALGVRVVERGEDGRPVVALRQLRQEVHLRRHNHQVRLGVVYFGGLLQLRQQQQAQQHRRHHVGRDGRLVVLLQPELRRRDARVLQQHVQPRQRGRARRELLDAVVARQIQVPHLDDAAGAGAGLDVGLRRGALLDAPAR